MATCGLCNRDNLGFMSGYTMSGISGKVCNECHSNLLKLRSSRDENAKQYFYNIIQTSPQITIKDFLSNEIETAKLSDSELLEEERRSHIEKEKKEINSVLLATSSSISNYHIEKYGNIVTGISVLGTGFFSELSANFSDALGVFSSSFENKIAEAKDDALYMLKKETHKIQCNAVISISINFVPFSGNMIGLVATGTAVKIIPN